MRSLEEKRLLRQMSRKQLLAKAKEERALKEQFRKELASFLIDFQLDTTKDIYQAYIINLCNGNRGYHKTRNKELIKEFEKIYADLNDRTQQVDFYSSDDREYMRNKNSYGTNRAQVFNEDQDTLRSLWIEKAEHIMSQLFESIVLL